MNLSNISTLSVTLFALFFLISCAGSDSGGPSAAATENGAQEVNAADHRPSRDTVDWQFAGNDGQPPWSTPVDREWPGEEIGVIGPIIAMGGRGAKAYISVYDPGGVFIGGLYLKEARKDPARLENLLRLAQVRGNIQNSRTVDQVSVLRFLRHAREARQRGTP